MRRTLVMLCTAVMLSATPGWAQEPVQLRFSGRPNDVFHDDMLLRVNFACGGADAKDAVDVEHIAMARQKTQVAAIAPNGNISLVLQPLRLAKGVKRNGAVMTQFDTADLASREKAMKVPELAVMVAALDSKARVEREPSGRTVDVVVESPDGRVTRVAEQLAEWAIVNDASPNFPQGPVRPGDTWDAGQRDFEFPGVGILRYRMSASLKTVHVLEDERVAEIAFKGERATYHPAPDAKGSLTVESVTVDGGAGFLIDRGRFLGQLVGIEMTARIREPDGRESTCRMRGSFRVEKAR